MSSTCDFATKVFKLCAPWTGIGFKRAEKSIVLGCVKNDGEDAAVVKEDECGNRAFGSPLQQSTKYSNRGSFTEEQLLTKYSDNDSIL